MDEGGRAGSQVAAKMMNGAARVRRSGGGPSVIRIGKREKRRNFTFIGRSVGRSVGPPSPGLPSQIC